MLTRATTNAVAPREQGAGHRDVPDPRSPERPISQIPPGRLLVRIARLPHLAALVGSGPLLLAMTVPAAAADDAMVRVLHGSPDAPSVDVFVDDGKVDALSGVEFGDLTRYVAVPAGTYAVKVCATADDTVCPIGPIDLTLEAG